MLNIQNLSAGYPGNPVLSQFSMELPEGTLTAVIGPNGCGKSTLLKAVTGLIPSTGTVTFRGLSLSELSPGERAKQISFLPQNRPVPEITAGKLVLHGRFPYLSYPRRYRESDKAAAREALEQMGIAHISHRMLTDLSGGERQKVYLAMVLAQDTPVILMDEPTTHLDISHKFELLRLARQLTHRGKTVVTVLHDLDLALNYADRIALMENGQLCMCASAEEIYESHLADKVFRVRMDRVSSPGGFQYYFLPQP